MAGGRPRDPGLDQRVLNATAQELQEVGLAGLRTDAVARRAGVPKSSIYRRWPSVRHLVVDAMAQAVRPARFQPSDDPVSDLRRLLAGLSSAVAGTELLQVGAQIMHDPELSADYRARLVEPNRRVVIEAVQRGQRTGVFRQDVDAELVIDQAIGALIYRVLFLHRPATDELVRQVGSDLMVRLGVQPGMS